MPTLQTDQQVLTRPQLARLLQCSQGHLSQLAREPGGLACFKVGKAVRYDKSMVEAWLAAQLTQAAA